MGETYDFSEFETEGEPQIGDNAQAQLEAIATKLLAAEAHLEACEAQLEEAKSNYNDIRLNELPDIMDQLGLVDTTTISGLRVSLKEEIRAGISKDNTEDAHQWLEDNGHGNLIKREIKIDFGRDDEAWAKKFLADCKKRKRQLNLAVKRAVNTQSLGAFVRRQLEEGALDADTQKLLGVFRQRFGSVKLPKEGKK